MSKSIKAYICDVVEEDLYPAEVIIGEDGLIKSVKPINEEELDKTSTDGVVYSDGVLVPGFIDAHIHVESTFLTPSVLGDCILPFGTTELVADPHEIANVSGVMGIKFMIQDSQESPVCFNFMAPSCVPATPFETSGAILGVKEIQELLKMDDIIGLGEMMNFPGVLSDDEDVLSKINMAKEYGLPVDGHAPLLTGDDLEKYVNTGISTDHECSSFQEAIEKRKLGMKIILREGSSAKNLEDILKLDEPDIGELFDGFLCSDDIHCQDLDQGHINRMLRKIVDLGVDSIDALKMATINPAEHYNLNTGSISPGKKANLVLVDNLLDFNVQDVYIMGEKIVSQGELLNKTPSLDFNTPFMLEETLPKQFQVNSPGDKVRVNVIEVVNHQLITNPIIHELIVKDGIVQADLEGDVLKIAVVERYGYGNISNGFVKGFGLKEGAIASSVAHDSHNIVVVGTSSEYMSRCVNIIRKNKGGLAFVSSTSEFSLELPIAGLMTNNDKDEVVAKVERLNELAGEVGSCLDAPFMSLSFMALLVIPSIKLSDKGLFDGSGFCFMSLFV